MKRLLIFALLGPFIGWLSVFAMTGVPPYRVPGLAILAFVWAYVLGIVPALIVCFVDWKLRDWAWRPLYCAVAGFLAAQALFIFPFRDVGPQGVLILGSIGAFAGAVCSWLSGKGQKTETA
jgi:hypothetical protein